MASDPYELVECPNCGARKLLWTSGLTAHTCKVCGLRSSAEQWLMAREEGQLVVTVAERNRRRALEEAEK